MADYTSLTDQRAMSITAPRIKVQKQIAAFLSAYDDLIENNKRRIALLEKMAEEVYREWFVRMRFPRHEKVKFVKGVPVDWEYKSINNMVNFLSGYPFKSYKYVQKGDYGIITIKNVHDGSNRKDKRDVIFGDR
jgi:type I restriction enzyme S subunit